MTRICFQIIVFNGDHVLEPCLKSILPFGKVVVTEGPVGYFAKQGISTSQDSTNKILHDFQEAGADISVVHGSFSEKDEMMNAGIHLIPKDTTHVWMVDADEIWEPDSIRRTISHLDYFDSVSFKPITFFGGFDRALGGFERRFEWVRIQRWYDRARWATHRPPTIFAPNGIPWKDGGRCLESGEEFAHYSYIFPKAVKSKSGYYASRGGNIENWFGRVWLPWVLGDDTKKQEIENEFNGVHEWLPQNRGDAFTYPFVGQHPKEIQRILPQLKERFNRELPEILNG